MAGRTPPMRPRDAAYLLARQIAAYLLARQIAELGLAGLKIGRAHV